LQKRIDILQHHAQSASLASRHAGVKICAFSDSRVAISPAPGGWLLRAAGLLLVSSIVVLAGCAGGSVTAGTSSDGLAVSPFVSTVDTNCTGCNSTNRKGASVQQFIATLPDGDRAAVIWSVSGGDATSGPGVISASGQYVPPSYLTSDRAQVVVTATLNATTKSTSVLNLTPGFLQPLTPENAALGAGARTTITGYLSEAGGAADISFSLANTAAGSGGGRGSLSVPSCQRSARAFTVCSVTYTAPSTIASTGVTYVVATTGSSRATTQLLLNTSGVSSNPAVHQEQMALPVQLGASGSNNIDYDLRGGQVADCCGGTLGSLVEDNTSHLYVLSNNHVLARSDQAGRGDPVVQPGLIDNNCTPLGDGPGTAQIGSLATWLPLSARATNADAALALVAPGAVDPSGSILELGVRQPDGTLGAAPPGISSTAGKGEAAALGQIVAKSGRTTGLTCASVSALDLDVSVDYFSDCAETKPYLTKTYTNQLAVTGNQFSDAGDSGSLVVDASNAEPLGLFFSGGVDASGVSQSIASPAPDVLNELASQSGQGASYSFVGVADHPVSCLSYGDSTTAAAQNTILSDAEMTRAEEALTQARLLVNPARGILGVAAGKSFDHPGEAAILVYVDEASSLPPPATIDGVRTMVIPTTARAVALGSTPQNPAEAAPKPLPASTLTQALAAKQRLARGLMQQNPAFFGVGVGQSLDNPHEAALVIYVDRKNLPDQLPATLGGLRTRYVTMDRLHVTRAYASPLESRSRCAPELAAPPAASSVFNPRDLKPGKILK
jgi:hypothetical protein